MSVFRLSCTAEYLNIILSVRVWFKGIPFRWDPDPASFQLTPHWLSLLLNWFKKINLKSLLHANHKRYSQTCLSPFLIVRDIARVPQNPMRGEKKKERKVVTHQKTLLSRERFHSREILYAINPQNYYKCWPARKCGYSITCYCSKEPQRKIMSVQISERRSGALKKLPKRFNNSELRLKRVQQS